VVGVDPAPGPGVPDGVEVLAEPYRAGHIRECGARLVFAAATPEVNRLVVADGRAADVWVNSATDPTAGDFIVPAVWRAGALTLTVSTTGASPALAAALRDRAAEALGPAAAGLAATLAALRPVVLARLDDPEARRRVLADWADPRWLALFEAGGPEAVRAEVGRLLDRQTGHGAHAPDPAATSGPPSVV
jgi:siroheme synthase-like protein